MSESDIRTSVRQFILDKFLPGEDPKHFTDSTPLMTGGILDSIATMTLATFLEKEFGIELQAYELSVDYLDTVTSIERLVQGKRGKQ